MLAIPVFRSRVAPVFDSCLQALVIGAADDPGAERSDLPLKNLTSSERVSMLKRAGVTTLICGGISHTLHAILESSGISVITGIAGEVEEVLSAFESHRLDDPKFCMPGRAGTRPSRREEGTDRLSDEEKGNHRD
ncbi:MAG: NifB/NifX family molybdenum-iron cluster-binding protein [Thermodesulfobacteriota bacterium]|nr:NifB/NifX family molybdenum-iron cluster-binding protein [Thermodesulfobacteriota bacterium]